MGHGLNSGEAAFGHPRGFQNCTQEGRLFTVIPQAALRSRNSSKSNRGEINLRNPNCTRRRRREEHFRGLPPVNNDGGRLEPKQFDEMFFPLLLTGVLWCHEKKGLASNRFSLFHAFRYLEKDTQACGFVPAFNKELPGRWDWGRTCIFVLEKPPRMLGLSHPAALNSP